MGDFSAQNIAREQRSIIGEKLADGSVVAEQFALCKPSDQVCENYQGYYGDAYRLQFPNYNGSIFVASIPVFQPPVCDIFSQANMNHSQKQTVVVAGSRNSPYFRIMSVKK